MRVAARCLVVILTGCGRIGFDPSTDALTGHDEDGDGIPDMIDVCPHLAGPQLDRDGDGVGDACDPEPLVARQSFAWFSPMITLPDCTGDPFTAAGDEQLSPASGGGLDCVIPVGVDLDVWMAVDVRAIDLAGDRQLMMFANAKTSAQQVYTEMYDDGVSPYSQITRFDGTYHSEITGALTGGIHPGRVDWHARFPLSTQNVEMHAGWPGEPYDLQALVPEFTGADLLRLRFNYVDVALRYLVVIRSD